MFASKSNHLFTSRLCVSISIEGEAEERSDTLLPNECRDKYYAAIEGTGKNQALAQPVR